MVIYKMAKAGGDSYKGTAKLRDNLNGQFNEYRQENNNIEREITRIVQVISKIEAYGDDGVSKKDVISKKSKLVGDEIYGEVFSALSSDGVRFKEYSNKLLDLLKNEESSIKEFMGLSTYDHISSNKYLLDRINVYNEDKLNIVQILFGYIPSLSDKLNGVVKVMELGIEHAGQYFINFYTEFIKHLDSSNSKSSLFFSLAKMLNDLVQYSEDFNSQYAENKEKFMGALHGSTVQTFAEKFFAGGYGYNGVMELNAILRKFSIDLTDLKSENTYDSLKESEDRDKIDKFVKKTLLHLLSDDSKLVTKVKAVYKDEDGNDSPTGTGSKDKLSETEIETFRKTFSEMGSLGLGTGKIEDTNKSTVKELMSEFLMVTFGDISNLKADKHKCPQFNKVCNAYHKDIWKNAKADGSLKELLKFVKDNESMIRSLESSIVNLFLKLLFKVIPEA